MSTARIAVVGGGQLARMMQQAAIGLDVHIRCLVEDDAGSAAQVIPDSIVGEAKQIAALRAISATTEALTFEHEHVDLGQLQELIDQGVRVRPGPEALACAQNKLTMRTRLSELGIPLPRWAGPATPRDIGDFVAQGPAIIKTTVGGYDGRGVRRIISVEDAHDWLTEHELIVEELVNFSRELAVLLARTPSGFISLWPIVETIQTGGICNEVFAPAPHLDPETASQAIDVAERIAKQLDVVGVLAVEMFELAVPRGDGTRIVVNELAMRPHNTGHWTIEGATTSQFEQHIRAVLDWPLGSGALREPVVVMANILGVDDAELGHRIEDVLASDDAIKVHLYGKAPRKGRKLGHVTAWGDDFAEVRHRANSAVRRILGHEQ